MKMRIIAKRMRLISSRHNSAEVADPAKIRSCSTASAKAINGIIPDYP